MKGKEFQRRDQHSVKIQKNKKKRKGRATQLDVYALSCGLVAWLVVPGCLAVVVMMIGVHSAGACDGAGTRAS